MNKQQQNLLIMAAILLVAGFFRLFKLDQVPAGLYWEEVAVGYDAYSIASTGLDHHGNPWPIVAFESFGDWKPALYFYLVAPLTKIIGLNAWSVRLPSALAGVVLVFLIMKLTTFFVGLLGEKSSMLSTKIGLLAGLMAALSPWLIQFSRGGWETNVATTLIVGGIYLTLTSTKLRYRLLAIILFAAAAYTYHAARLIAPGLLFLIVAWQWWQNKTKHHLVLASLSLVGLLVFFIPFLLPSQQLAVGHRFQETSIFSNPEPVIESNLRRERAGNSFLARLIYHRYVYYGKLIVSQAASHLTLNYLILSGDANPRHGIGIGIIWPIDLLLIGLALIVTVKKKPDLLLLFFGWLAVVLFPASVSLAAPHALRTLALAPLYICLAAIGAWWLIRRFGRISWIVLTSLYLVFFAAYWRYYLRVYPIVSANEWQVGYQEMVDQVNQLFDKNPEMPVYINRHQGRPAMYYWFYSKTDPKAVQAEERIAQKDQAEFLSFQNINFIDQLSQINSSQAIIAADPEQLLNWGREYQLVSEIKQPSGKVVWSIALIK